MPSDAKGKGGLSILLGIGKPKPGASGEDLPDDPKKLAAETLMDAVKEGDVDSFMMALDDYLEFRNEGPAE